jgi:C1A family cysteine protease
MSKRRLNWRPDLPDFRDWKYSTIEHEVKKAVQLPPSADLRALCSPVFDQSNLGSCTSQAIAGMLEFLELQAERQNLQSSETFGDNQYDPISRLFIYYNERLKEGDPQNDGGAQIRTGIQVIKTVGFCRESLWPYIEDKFSVKPADEAYAEAQKHRAIYHFRLNDLNDMKTCLANGYPFVLGIAVYESFMSEQTASTGIVQMPTPFESCEGGHAVMCVGYDDSKNCLIIRNSWGPTWGDKGYFYLPYDYITTPGLADDFWTVRQNKNKV